jgi:hypothetical protein
MELSDVDVSFEDAWHHADAVDGWSEGSRHYDATVSFEIGGKRVARDFEYHVGSGVTGAPKRRDLLSCLALDATSGDQSFEDFCSDFGYDTDSRKAYATWEACRESGEKLRDVFGTAFEDFCATEWDA